MATNEAASFFTLPFEGENMTEDQITAIHDVFEYVWEVAKQSKLIVQDAVEALHKETRCYFRHERAWDYTTMKSGNHFLNCQFEDSRAWMTFV